MVHTIQLAATDENADTSETTRVEAWGEEDKEDYEDELVNDKYYDEYEDQDYR